MAQPDTPKLKTSTGEAVLRTTEPPSKNLPTHEEMKRKAVETDDAVKQHKVKTEQEKLPKAVRCRPDDTVCQEYWKKQGKPSKNISLLPPAETPINSLTNLIAANHNPFANWLALSDAPQGFGTLTRLSSYRPPTTANRPPFLAAAMLQSGVYFGGWATEMTQRRNETGGDSLFSGNYFWSVPVLDLPGRAGHELNLSLTYNSHVWTKTSSVMALGSYSIPGNGFNLGLPSLNSATQTPGRA